MPGADAQYRMAPVGRKRMDELALQANDYRLSAVMILLCVDETGQPFIPLIERVAYNGAHSGQISLPGGKFEEQDEYLKFTALRECREEIGIAEVEVLGSLTGLFIPVSQFKVQPFVGFCPLSNPVFSNQEREVKRIINLSLADLLNHDIIKEGGVDLPDKTRMKVPYFEVGEHKVWGATAMILSELKELLL